MVDAAGIEQLLRAALPLERVTVEGSDGRYQVTAVGACFDGASRVRRQQMVYAPIAHLIRDGSVHAVGIVARTPAESSGP
jgi:acid stress-induced BolA-like protein IbaG/YrbA